MPRSHLVSEQNTHILLKLPLEILIYLAFNYLDYDTATKFIAIALRSSAALSVELNHRERSIKNLSQAYHDNQKRYSDYSLTTDISAGPDSSFYFSSGRWFGCGFIPWREQLEVNTPQALTLQYSRQFIFNFWPTSPQPLKPIKIACSNLETLFLTASGDVYIARSNEASSSWCFGFAKLVLEKLSIKDVADICAGCDHFLLRTKNGKVYSFGNNRHGQLGLGNFLENASTPELIQELADKKIMSIFAGGDHSFCISDHNEIYGFGWNEFGQLGTKTTARSQYTPLPIEAFGKEIITDIALGFNHTIFLIQTGIMYSCGENSTGKLGLGNFEDPERPTQISHLAHYKIVMVATGDAHTVCLTDNGQVFGFGNCERGQLGLECKETNIPMPISSLPDKIIKIVAGDYHTLCLSTQRIAYAFGQNKNGQLGLGHSKDEYLPHKITPVTETVSPAPASPR
ncbi:hypothetical protein FOLKNPGA_01932 [Legionella sp. PC1000]|uniref:RCC1 domain-containing protein n=1 Tax=Legionella sp. PC1000 TaxID=2746060 RepID=UPI0015FE5592|nr:hypothetical protein [Legionella sp. PC1000]QLZ69150.1 hypothetical protein FOLKNPGA_01932 [Legionella sp. PC1000]